MLAFSVSPTALWSSKFIRSPSFGCFDRFYLGFFLDDGNNNRRSRFDNRFRDLFHTALVFLCEGPDLTRLSIFKLDSELGNESVEGVNALLEYIGLVASTVSQDLMVEAGILVTAVLLFGECNGLVLPFADVLVLGADPFGGTFGCAETLGILFLGGAIPNHAGFGILSREIKIHARLLGLKLHSHDLFLVHAKEFRGLESGLFDLNGELHNQPPAGVDTFPLRVDAIDNGLILGSPDVDGSLEVGAFLFGVPRSVSSIAFGTSFFSYGNVEL